ncbi:hypothetical protein VPH35_050209 [Triticum aestivum]
MRVRCPALASPSLLSLPAPHTRLSPAMEPPVAPCPLLLSTNRAASQYSAVAAPPTTRAGSCYAAPHSVLPRRPAPAQPPAFARGSAPSGFRAPRVAASAWPPARTRQLPRLSRRHVRLHALRWLRLRAPRPCGAKAPALTASSPARSASASCAERPLHAPAGSPRQLHRLPCALAFIAGTPPVAAPTTSGRVLLGARAVACCSAQAPLLGRRRSSMTATAAAPKRAPATPACPLLRSAPVPTAPRRPRGPASASSAPVPTAPLRARGRLLASACRLCWLRPHPGPAAFRNPPAVCSALRPCRLHRAVRATRPPPPPRPCRLLAWGRLKKSKAGCQVPADRKKDASRLLVSRRARKVRGRLPPG